MITFGRFGRKNNKEKDKENFLESLNSLFETLLMGYPNASHKTLNEKEIINPIKKLLKKEANYYSKEYLGLSLASFLPSMGLTYYTLTQKEVEEIVNMDFTYENWEKNHWN